MRCRERREYISFGGLNRYKPYIYFTHENSIELRRNETDSHTATPDIDRLLWSLKVHYRVTTARHWALSWAELIQSTIVNPFFKILLTIILPIRLQNYLFRNDFPAKIVYAYPISYSGYTSRLSPSKGRAIAQVVSDWLPTATARFKPGSGQVGFVVDKLALGQVFSEYFGFPCQSSFHQILHDHNHPGQVQ
jgi:hypothetical protein